MKRIICVALAAGLLAACGGTTEHRADSGAAVGADTGVAASPQQANLAEPAWQDRDQRIALAGDDVRQAQRTLRAEGFYHGRIDGIAGPRTRTAVAQYQRRNGLGDTATLDGQTMARLNSDAATSYGASGTIYNAGGRR
jgi:peptidoglycan hydrolase-like protein with peptidoglycan-binding domain